MDNRIAEQTRWDWKKFIQNIQLLIFSKFFVASEPPSFPEKKTPNQPLILHQRDTMYSTKSAPHILFYINSFHRNYMHLFENFKLPAEWNSNQYSSLSNTKMHFYCTIFYISSCYKFSWIKIPIMPCLYAEMHQLYPISLYNASNKYWELSFFFAVFDQKVL